jgi:hypothetical protein
MQITIEELIQLSGELRAAAAGVEQLAQALQHLNDRKTQAGT